MAVPQDCVEIPIVGNRVPPGVGGGGDYGFLMEEEFGGYGEGGGGGARAPIRSADLAMLRMAMKEKLAELAETNCKNYLPLGKMAEKLEDLKFIDVRIAGEMRVHYFIPTSDQRTLTEVVGDAFAVILSSQDTMFAWVVLGANFFGRPEAANAYSEQRVTLVHALLHYAAQATDEQLWKKFRLGSLYPGIGHSKAISDWILDNCPNPK